MSLKDMKKSPAPKPKVVLVLQGGGALGAYHIGAYQALEEAGFRPDWVSGISIGAINAAILVGNEPDRRLSPAGGAVARHFPAGGLDTAAHRRLPQAGQHLQQPGSPGVRAAQLLHPALSQPVPRGSRSRGGDQLL